MIYTEDDYLQLSGLQHFSFCRRQWALIHIEDIWKDNLRTTEGQIMHERAHDASIHERRGDVINVRGVRVSSAELGTSGICDVLEYHKAEEGIILPYAEGKWIPYPVEYKRGSPKENPADILQLCGQALCLEEMLCCEIPEGALFYGEIRRREIVLFGEELRQTVKDQLFEMHNLFSKGHTPKVKPTKACNACSLKEHCLPKLMNTKKASVYLAEALEG